MSDTATIIAPEEVFRETMREAVTVLHAASGRGGATNVANTLTSLCERPVWNEHALRMARSGLYSFHTLLVHESDPDFWVRQMTNPDGTLPAGLTDLATDIAEERLAQAKVLRTAITMVETVLRQR